MTVLEDLWYGNINPHETFLNGNCRFKHLLSLMGRNRDNLSDTLTEQQKGDSRQVRRRGQRNALRRLRGSFPLRLLLRRSARDGMHIDSTFRRRLKAKSGATAPLFALMPIANN